jgi:plastocyanin
MENRSVGFALVAVLGLGTLVLAPVRVAADDVGFTLYGDAADGWGFASDNMSNPGPTLVVYAGDRVNLTLIGNDSALHNWFIDYDNDLVDDPEEPNSADFVGTTISFEFFAARAGTFTYRCRVHSTTMTGTIEVRAAGRPRALTLYGDALLGWGLDPGNITNPGPPIVWNVGDNVTLTLVGNDSALHNWFIDFDGDRVDDPAELSSADFQANTTVFRFVVTPELVGNWTYRCRIHPTTMTGSIEIRGSGGVPPPPPPIPLIPAIMVGTIVFVLVFAAAYHVRAVRADRKSR